MIGSLVQDVGFEDWVLMGVRVFESLLKLPVEVLTELFRVPAERSDSYCRMEERGSSP